MVLTDKFWRKICFLQSFNKFIFLFFQIFQIHTFFQIYTLVNHIDGNTGHEEWLSGKHRTSPPNVFCKKGVLENFTKFTGKHLCQSLFLIKLQASDVFLGIQVFSYEYYEVFKNSFFMQYTGGCFCLIKIFSWNYRKNSILFWFSHQIS